MRTGMLLTTLLSITLMSSAAVAANYYKWTDEHGVTHYSARKPTNQDAEVIRISAGGRSQPQESESSQPAGDAPSASQSASAKGSAAAQKDEERCNWAKATLETLRNHNRVRVQGDDGELRYLTEEEKAEQRQMAEEALKDAC